MDNEILRAPVVHTVPAISERFDNFIRGVRLYGWRGVVVAGSLSLAACSALGGGEDAQQPLGFDTTAPSESPTSNNIDVEPVVECPETEYLDLRTDPGLQMTVMRIINSFEAEHDSEIPATEIRYGNLVDIQDGRGLTSQDVLGLTSGTLDLEAAILSYVNNSNADRVKAEALTPYLAQLAPISQRYRERQNNDEPELPVDENGITIPGGDVEGLDTAGLTEAFADAAEDPVFTEVMNQFFIVEKLTAAQNLLTDNGVTVNSPIGLAMVIDAFVQHGDENVKLLIEATAAQLVEKEFTEAEWLAAFNAKRVEMVKDFDQVGELQESTRSRVAALQSIQGTCNANLTGEITWVAYGDSFSIMGVSGTAEDSVPVEQPETDDFLESSYREHTVTAVVESGLGQGETAWDHDGSSGNLVIGEMVVALPINSHTENSNVDGAQQYIDTLIAQGFLPAGSNTFYGLNVEVTNPKNGKVVIAKLGDSLGNPENGGGDGAEFGYVFGTKNEEEVLPRDQAMGIEISESVAAALGLDDTVGTVTWTLVRPDRLEASMGRSEWP